MGGHRNPGQGRRAGSGLQTAGYNQLEMPKDPGAIVIVVLCPDPPLQSLLQYNAGEPGDQYTPRFRELEAS